jgi:hypothetical protein
VTQVTQWENDVAEITKILRDIRGVLSAKAQPSPDCPGCRELGAAREDALRTLRTLQTLRTERDEDDARYMKALKRIANADDEIERLRARVEELETDAKLGRLVREMLEGTSLHHNINGFDEWSYGPGPFWTWEATPEAALEAARKEET